VALEGNEEKIKISITQAAKNSVHIFFIPSLQCSIVGELYIIPDMVSYPV
jgi:hypothetical protein